MQDCIDGVRAITVDSKTGPDIIFFLIVGGAIVGSRNLNIILSIKLETSILLFCILHLLYFVQCSNWFTMT